MAGPQVEPDEDVPAPQSPVIVWKDPALRASVHSQSHKDTSTSMGSCTDGEHILPCGCSSDLGSISFGFSSFLLLGLTSTETITVFSLFGTAEREGGIGYL